MGQQETRDEYFKKGMLIHSHGKRTPGNDEMDDREKKALDEENQRPWGRKEFPQERIAQRAKDGGNK